MRKRFDLQAWLKDKSQKVETRCGFPARIICCDRAVREGEPTELKLCVLVQEDGGEIVYLYYSDGTKWAKDENYDLFIVTPEEELTEFEYALGQVLMECPDPEEDEEWYPFLKENAAELLALASKQLQPEIDAIDNHCEALCTEYEKGRADALKDLPRWRKIGENGLLFSSTQFVINGRYLEMNDTLNDVYEIALSDLAKLPKEDSHE